MLGLFSLQRTPCLKRCRLLYALYLCVGRIQSFWCSPVVCSPFAELTVLKMKVSVAFSFGFHMYFYYCKILSKLLYCSSLFICVLLRHLWVTEIYTCCKYQQQCKERPERGLSNLSFLQNKVKEETKNVVLCFLVIIYVHQQSTKIHC